MALVEKELNIISKYVPDGAVNLVIDYLHRYKIHLIIRRERKSVLGDYRPPHQGKPHTISVNCNLNRYHFLITFIHELAHLITHEKYGRKVSPHGTEWKQCFGHLLKEFIALRLFPHDIELALFTTINSPAASTCSDPHLFKILRNHDSDKATVLVEKIPIGSHFKTEKGQRFQVHAKRRTRYECIEIATQKKYLFPGIYEVYKE